MPGYRYKMALFLDTGYQDIVAYFSAQVHGPVRLSQSPFFYFGALRGTAVDLWQV